MSCRKSSPSIVVVGSANTDLIVRTPRLPGPGETVLGGEFSQAAGGKGANQAVAAARADGRVAFVARIGKDAFGARLLKEMRGEGIDLSHVVRDRKTPSGVALIFVGPNGENSITVAGGSNSALSPADIDAAQDCIRRAKVLVVQLETPLTSVEHAVKLAKAAGVRVILNPAPASELPAALVGQCDFLTPNEHEASLLTGIRVSGTASAAKAARALRAKGTGAVIITMGARGVYVSAPGLEGLIEGFRMKAVDTTAAGDVFNGTLATGIAEGMPLRQAIRFAQAAAAISVTRAGAQPSIPARRETEALLASI